MSSLCTVSTTEEFLYLCITYSNEVKKRLSVDIKSCKAVWLCLEIHGFVCSTQRDSLNECLIGLLVFSYCKRKTHSSVKTHP